jgi:hypothetical protein
MKKWWRTENWDFLALVEFVLSLVLYVYVSKRNLQRDILASIPATLYDDDCCGLRWIHSLFSTSFCLLAKDLLFFVSLSIG